MLHRRPRVWRCAAEKQDFVWFLPQAVHGKHRLAFRSRLDPKPFLDKSDVQMLEESSVVEHEFAATYAYYKVPIPWLQVKLLRLLQYYPPSGEPTTDATLTDTDTLHIRGPYTPDHAAGGSPDDHEQLQ